MHKEIAGNVLTPEVEVMLVCLKVIFKILEESTGFCRKHQNYSQITVKFSIIKSKQKSSIFIYTQKLKTPLTQMKIESSVTSRTLLIYFVLKAYVSQKGAESRRTPCNVSSPSLPQHYKFIKLSHIIYFRIWSCREKQQHKEVLVRKWANLASHSKLNTFSMALHTSETALAGKSFLSLCRNHLHHLRFSTSCVWCCEVFTRSRSRKWRFIIWLMCWENFCCCWWWLSLRQPLHTVLNLRPFISNLCQKTSPHTFNSPREKEDK